MCLFKPTQFPGQCKHALNSSIHNKISGAELEFCFNSLSSPYKLQSDNSVSFDTLPNNMTQCFDLYEFTPRLEVLA